MIRPDDLVEDVVQRSPQTVRVFMSHRFPCLVCGEPVWGTIRENAERNGITGAAFDRMMADLNAAVSDESR